MQTIPQEIKEQIIITPELQALLQDITREITDIEYINILPRLRGEHQHLNPILDLAILKLWIDPAWHNGFYGLFIKGYHIDKDTQKPYMDYYEYDALFAFMNYDYSELPPEHLLLALALIMSCDCTDCCNALEFINISQHGIVAQGNISMTYHS